jgi:hypothetical protein
VKEFVNECRREWKRLGVPKAVADEMADELVADLAEAEAEGVSWEEVLGSSDPRSFAARWASERGVIPRRRWTSRLPAAVATVALVPAIVGAVVLIVASPDKERRMALAPPPTTLAVSVPARTPPALRVRLQTVEAVAAADQARWVHTLVLAGEPNRSDDDDHTIGSALLIVGLALLAPLTLFWLWRGLKRA